MPYELRIQVEFSIQKGSKYFNYSNFPLRIITKISSAHFSRSVMSDSLWPHGQKHTQASLSITNSQSLPKLMSMESVMPSNHLILCPPLLLLLSIFPGIRVFVLHKDSRVWIYFQFISKPQGTHWIFFQLVCFCLFPLEKSGQWLIQEEISLEFGWGFSKRHLHTSEFIKAKAVAISLQA